MMNFDKLEIKKKSTPIGAWLAAFLGTAICSLVAGLSQNEPWDLNVQMVPGIWIEGTNGPVRLEYTTDPHRAGGWTPLATVSASNTAYFYIDTSATNSAMRFYRAVSASSVPPTQTNIIAILGDSISTDYPPRHDWVEFMPLYSTVWSNSVIHNFALSGQGSKQALSRYATTVHTVRPSQPNETGWLFAWLGITEITTNRDSSFIYDNLKQLWQLARADGFKVAAFTTTRGGGWTPENGMYQQWELVNNLILSDPTLYDALCRPDVLFPAPVDPLYFMDGIHPTPLGAHLVAQWITQNMDGHW